VSARFAAGRGYIVERMKGYSRPFTVENILAVFATRHSIWTRWSEQREQHLDVALETIEQPDAILDAVARHFERGDHRDLIVSGPVGVGKTRIGVSMYREHLFRGDSVMFVSAVEPGLYKDQHGADIVIIDDVGTENMTPTTREDLFRYFDRRWESGKNTIITTNLDLNAFVDHVGERVYDRIDGPRITLDGASRRREPLDAIDPTFNGRYLADHVLDEIRRRLGTDEGLWRRWIDAVVEHGLYELLDSKVPWVEDWQTSALVAIASDVDMFGDAMFGTTDIEWMFEQIKETADRMTSDPIPGTDHAACRCHPNRARAG
jgi:hypothetical protein